MNHFQFVRRTATVVLAICGSLLSFALFAPSAFAMIPGPGRTPTVGSHRWREHSRLCPSHIRQWSTRLSQPVWPGG